MLVIESDTCASGFIPRASNAPRASAKASLTGFRGSSRAYERQNKIIIIHACQIEVFERVGNGSTDGT